MMIKKWIAMSCIALSVLGVSCSSDDGPAKATLTMEIVGLQELTNGASYEGWIIVDGQPVSTGKFTSTAGSQTFSVVAESLEKATQFILSVEPPNDSDPGPSASKLLSGNFSGGAAQVTVNTVVADLSGISGKFIMKTPTDIVADNDESGVWFMDPSGATAVAGLDLPTLPANSGWKYEGWVVINGTPVTTGTFSNASAGDDSSPFSGNGEAPNFPGEDFLNNAPAGLTFPQDGDVRGKTVVISIEPFPDYDQAAPFFLKPLSGTAGQITAPTTNDLTPSNDAPFGRVTR